MTSIPRRGLPTCLPALPTRRSRGWSNCFLGIGQRRPSTHKRPNLRPSPKAYAEAKMLKLLSPPPRGRKVKKIWPADIPGHSQSIGSTRSAAAAGRATCVALLACAIAHHREILALAAHVARIALCDRADAALGFQLLGVRLGGGGFGGCLVGEEGGDIRFGAGFAGGLFRLLDSALFVIALEGDDFGGGDRDGGDRFEFAGSAAGERSDRAARRCLGGSGGCCALRLAGRAVDLAAGDERRLVAAGPAGGEQVGLAFLDALAECRIAEVDVSTWARSWRFR